MRFNILIGGSAGQGINKVSQILSNLLARYGYYSFNYRDYQSLIRGGHNFNVLCFSDSPVNSCDFFIDMLVALDEDTVNLHKKQMKKDSVIIKDDKNMLNENLNIILSGTMAKILGIPEEYLIDEIKKDFKNEELIACARQGFNSEQNCLSLKKLSNKVEIMSGSSGVALGALNSRIQLYIAYPMTPATGVMHELASKQTKDLMVFQAESEIAVANMALGASFAGKKTFIGTSGGGFDLMSEALSLQGISEIPLCVYLASRPGPGTGVPTYSSQCDLDIALRAGHGEFPRIVIAPGDAIECIEKTNEALYLAHKFNSLSVLLSDKNLAESEYSFSEKANSGLKIEFNREIPGKSKIVKASSYETDNFGNSTENGEQATKNAGKRIEKYNKIKKDCKKFEMIKIYGNTDSKNLIVGWGSTKGAILDAINGLDCKFLQVLYLKPISDEIRQELQKAKNIILIEQNITGQLGRLIREKTGIKIEKQILKYDGRPFFADELKEEIRKAIR